MKIELGNNYTQPSPTSSDGAEGLHLYLDNLCVLELPEEGIISFHYKKGPVTATEAGKGKPAHASADLLLTEICDYNDGSDHENYKESEDSEDDNQTIDDLFEEASESEKDKTDEKE
jgi:hypothetical protein